MERTLDRDQPWGLAPADCPADGPPADDDLAIRARTDRRAFAALYRRHVDPIFRFCRRRLGTNEDAEDATAQVFLKALHALPSFRGGSFRAWLFTIADRETADRLRSRRPTASLDAAMAVADRAPSPEDLALATDAGDRLHRMLADLTADQRRVVELRLSGLDGNEIAQVLGRNRNAIDALQFRAFNRLRRLGAADRRGHPDG